MEKDTGAIVEKVVRRSGIGIAELARILHVDRRSIYYWFKQPNLKIDILYKIGDALGYDFSKDFPHLMESKTVSEGSNSVYRYNAAEEGPEAVELWKRKYIGLLEKYNELLLKISVKKNSD